MDAKGTRKEMHIILADLSLRLKTRWKLKEKERR